MATINKHTSPVSIVGAGLFSFISLISAFFYVDSRSIQNRQESAQEAYHQQVGNLAEQLIRSITENPESVQFSECDRMRYSGSREVMNLYAHADLYQEATTPLEFTVAFEGDATYLIASLASLDPELSFLPEHLRNSLSQPAKRGIEVEISGDEAVAYAVDLTSFDSVQGVLSGRSGVVENVHLDRSLVNRLSDLREDSLLHPRESLYPRYSSTIIF